jgi:co-chaperonin GroES (HSP10)
MRSDLRSALQKRTPTRMSPQEGKIIAVSPVVGMDLASSSLSTSRPETASSSESGGTEVKMGDEELLIMKESDLFGIVD